MEHAGDFYFLGRGEIREQNHRSDWHPAGSNRRVRKDRLIGLNPRAAFCTTQLRVEGLAVGGHLDGYEALQKKPSDCTFRSVFQR